MDTFCVPGVLYMEASDSVYCFLDLFFFCVDVAGQTDSMVGLSF
jgi:hypothetical protein